MAYVVLTRRYEREGAEPPRVLVEAYGNALRQVREYAFEDQPWAKPAEQRHRAVVQTYCDAASELWRTLDPKDRELAEKIDELVARFPHPVTRRTELAAAAYEYDLRHRRPERAPDGERTRDRGMER